MHKMNTIKFSKRKSGHNWLLYILPIIFLISCSVTKTDVHKKALVNQSEFLSSNKLFKPKFEKKINDLYKEFTISGDFLFAVVNEKGLAYSFALNDDIINKHPSNLDNNSPIYIASHTKSFTATLLEILAEDGLVDLDKSITDYLPELTLADSIDRKHITVRRLLNHTHGIHSTKLSWKTAFLGYGGGDNELINNVNSDFRYDPSHRFRYSNQGPILAAMIVKKVTGNSWKTEMKKRIFRQLNMQHTSTNVSDFPASSIRPAIRVTKDNRVFQSGFYKKDITMHAAGGIISTINDLSIWLQANINQDKKLLKENTSWRDLTQPSTSQHRTYFTYHRYAYSLGWDIATYQKDTILTRFGGTAGISFHISYIPAKKIGVIAFSNDSRATKLPHLAANYAYNLINKLPEAEEIFENEKKLFTKSFEKSSNQPVPLVKDLLTQNNANDHFVGHYNNSVGWPNIEITNAGPNYQIKWGVLSGPIYKTGNPERPYLATLGALDRTFNIRADSLFTGSLKYTKQELQN